MQMAQNTQNEGGKSVLTFNVVFELLPVADEKALEVSVRTELDEEPQVPRVHLGRARAKQIDQIQMQIQIRHDLHFTQQGLQIER